MKNIYTLYNAYPYFVNRRILTSMNEEDEMLTLFDLHENSVGSIRRADIGSLTPEGGRYIRAANAFIQRSSSEIWVPTRSMHKSIAPGGLDYSVGGHVAIKESYTDCILRECKEEANITVDAASLQPLKKLHPTDDASIYFCQLFLITTDAKPQLSSEHTKGEWCTVDELIARLENGTAAKKSLLADVYTLASYSNAL